MTRRPDGPRSQRRARPPRTMRELVGRASAAPAVEPPDGSTLGRRVGAPAGGAVQRCPVEIGSLRRRDARGLARPGLERRRLERPPVGERELPRMGAALHHRVQVGGRVLVALAAGEEHDPRNGCRDVAVEHLERPLCDLLDPRPGGRLVAGQDHVRLQERPAKLDPLVVKLGVEGLERPAGRLRALARSSGRRPSAPRARRSARSLLPVRARRNGRARARSPRRSTRSDGRRRSSRSARHFANRAPSVAVLREALAQPVEALGHRLAGGERERLRSPVDLDPRDHRRVRRAAPGRACRRRRSGGSSRRT